MSLWLKLCRHLVAENGRKRLAVFFTCYQRGYWQHNHRRMRVLTKPIINIFKISEMSDITRSLISPFLANWIHQQAALLYSPLWTSSILVMNGRSYLSNRRFWCGGGRAFLRVSSKYVATLKGLWYIMDEPYVLHIQYHSWISVRSTLWRNTSEYRRKSKKYYFGTFLFQKFWRMTYRQPLTW